jgi:hypothetical protein
MKKKVGELYDKPIVIGNPNEFTKNEIALSDLEGDSFDDVMKYYDLDHNKLQNTGVRMAALDNITSSTITDDGLLVAAKNATPYGIGKYIEVNTKIMVPYEETYLTVYEFLNSLIEHTGKEWQHFAKEITAKEYYSLLN